MNVLLVLSQLEVTGAEIYAAQLADALIERGHGAIIVSDTLTRQTRARYLPMDLNNRTPANRIRHIRLLAELIEREEIDIVHAHSRASSWVASVAARLSGVPMVTTVHGRQPTHLSRRLVKGFGACAIAVCENIAGHLTDELGVPPSRIQLIRNGIIPHELPPREERNGPPVLSIIGRLSGPKGEVAHALVTKVLADFPELRVLVIGGRVIPERFRNLPAHIEMLGYVENVWNLLAQSDVVIGAGQVPMKSLSAGIPTIAVGEAHTVGLITPENFDEALRSNFGDIASGQHHDWEMIRRAIPQALAMRKVDESLRERARREFALDPMVDAVLGVYRRTLGRHHRRDVPVLTYHRVVDRNAPRGRHGLWVTAERFERQLLYLKRNGIRTITFEHYLSLSEQERHSGRYVVLTFDDGYRDNYEIMFPILKRHGATAVIFLVPDQQRNVWDQEEPGEPALDLLTPDQIAEMSDYGIEFGAHTLTHPRLTALDPEEAMREIVHSRERVTALAGRRPISFCYPYGALDENIKKMVSRSGYQLGIASDSGPVAMMEDPFELRRIQVFPGTGGRGFSRKVAGDYLYRRMDRGR